METDEPFKSLLTQGMVLNGGVKMSKSIAYTVDPAQVINTYGAYKVRVSMVFAPPLEQSLVRSDTGVIGPHRL